MNDDYMYLYIINSQFFYLCIAAYFITKYDILQHSALFLLYTPYVSIYKLIDFFYIIVSVLTS